MQKWADLCKGGIPQDDLEDWENAWDEAHPIH
jgi:hypothetical protein